MQRSTRNAFQWLARDRVTTPTHSLNHKGKPLTGDTLHNHATDFWRQVWPPQDLEVQQISLHSVQEYLELKMLDSIQMSMEQMGKVPTTTHATCNYATLASPHRKYNSTTLPLPLLYTTLHPAVVGEVTDQVITQLL